MTRKYLLLTVACWFLLALLCSCDSSKGSPDSPVTTKAPPSLIVQTPFVKPLEPSAYELPSGALATWRTFAKQKPALLLYSSHPFLEPLAKDTRHELRKLIQESADNEIIRRGQLFVADPVFFPFQTVSAAIEAGLISELIVVMPISSPTEEMNLETIRQLLLKNKFLSEEEADRLSLDSGIVSGTVRGVPLQMIHPDILPHLTGPVILHIDLSYFKPLYANEIKTPAFTLLKQLVMSIRNKNLNTLAVTLSYSNQEVGLSLDSRFMIRYLADFLRDPNLIKDPPESWKILSQSRYLSNMFQEHRARALLMDQAESASNDPAFLFALATAQFQGGLSDEGFSTLDKAVNLDPGYALEYLELAEKGESMNRREKTIELYNKAVLAYPHDPFVRLQLTEYLMRIDRGRDALPILQDLKALPWSERVYPDMPKILDSLQEEIEKGSTDNA